MSKINTPKNRASNGANANQHAIIINPGDCMGTVDYDFPRKDGKLRKLQSLVGGHIEAVLLDRRVVRDLEVVYNCKLGNKVALILNEDGRRLGLEGNDLASSLHEACMLSGYGFVGTAVVVSMA